MKSLTQFIKESQYIDESLIGDVVRKLLDTGLSWIEGSAKWVADHIVKTTAELWDTSKHITDRGWGILRTRSGYGGYGAPRDEYEYAKIMAGLHRGKDLEDELKYINDTFAKLKSEFGSNDDWIKNSHVQRMQACFAALSNPKTSDEEKETALKELNHIKLLDKNKNGKYGLTKQIDDFLKDYEKHNKEK